MSDGSKPLETSRLARPTAAQLRVECAAQLQAGEEILAYFAPDLDHALRFEPGLVALTNQRIISVASAVQAGPRWQSWPLTQDLLLREAGHGTTGTLELIGPQGRLAHWRYTKGRAADVRRLVQRQTDLRLGRSAETEDAEEAETETSRSEKLARTVSLFRLWRFAKQHIGMILLGVSLTLVTTAAGLIPPYLTIPLLDGILIPYQTDVNAIRAEGGKPTPEQAKQLEQVKERHRSRFALVPWYLAGLALAAVVAWLSGFAQGVVSNRVSERINAGLRNATYGHLMHLSLEFFGDKRTGDLISRINTDTDRICAFLSDTVVDFCTDALTILGTAAVLASIDPLLGLTTFLTFPLIGWLIYWVRGHLASGFSRSYRAWDAMTSILADTIPGVRVVKAFAQERREIERFRQSNEIILRANIRVATVWSFFWPLVGFLNQAGLLVIWALGCYRVFGHQITVGVLTAFVGYIGRFYARLESMTRLFSAVERAATSTYRIFEILDRVPGVREPSQPISPGRVHGRIELRNVGFHYGSRSVVEGLNLTIEPGEMVGIVGPSGAGKTTLVNLLCRFYDVGDGAILVDGVDIRSFPIAEYRQNIGIVLQEPFLFFGTIGENIAYGRPQATPQEIMAAARAARAHNFILQRPLAYDSLVGERGQQLSGGERQRISIARAILIDPRILILDEATSSVDTETEREIQRALDNLVQGRTTIAIAHRLSTLQRANRLIVLERGKIVEMGRHDELLAQGGLYSRLYHAQQTKHEAGD